ECDRVSLLPYSIGALHGDRAARPRKRATCACTLSALRPLRGSLAVASLSDLFQQSQVDAFLQEFIGGIVCSIVCSTCLPKRALRCQRLECIDLVLFTQ